jgi:hypothetical protein
MKLNHISADAAPDPKRCCPPFFKIDGDIFVSSTDAYNGWRFDTVPPVRFALTAARNEGVEISRDEFLRAVKNSTRPK